MSRQEEEMDLGHRATERPAPLPCVIDLRPFESPAPYLVRIIRDVGGRAPGLLERRAAMDAILALYCVDAIPFRDPDRRMPVAMDEYVISECLRAARSYRYGRGGIGIRNRPDCDVPTASRLDARHVWPKIEKALKDVLGLDAGRKLRLRDIDDLLFTRNPGDEASMFAFAVAAMVLAIQSR
ncbi:hypothetical protein L0Y59_01345 [Candidatus Uhrbacteria bacterium]|nr:hypothetical protein [Candidatus Uhrbacteria bacterium]